MGMTGSTGTLRYHHQSLSQLYRWVSMEPAAWHGGGPSVPGEYPQPKVHSPGQWAAGNNGRGWSGRSERSLWPRVTCGLGCRDLDSPASTGTPRAGGPASSPEGGRSIRRTLIRLQVLVPGLQHHLAQQCFLYKRVYR